MASGSSRSRLVTLFLDRNVRPLWLVGGIFGFMRWLEMLAVGVFVFDLTNSPFAVAVVSFLRMLPLLMFGAFTGAIGEHANRKRLLTGGLTMLFVTSMVLGVLVVTGEITLWHIGVGAFLSGVFWSTDFPVRRTMLLEAAGSERLSSAMGLESATNQATRMLGPLLGGLLLELIGLHGTYFLGAILYGLAAALVLRLHYQQRSARTEVWRILASVLGGFRYVRSQSRLVGALAVTVIMNFWGFAYVSMVPVIGRDTLDLGPSLVGMLMSADAMGGLVASICFALTGPSTHHVRFYLTGSFVYLLAVLLFSMSPSFEMSIALLFLAGCGFGSFAVMQGTIAFSSATPEVRSRVMGAMTLSIGIGPIGMLHVGLLADWFGATLAVAIIALEGIVLLVAALFVWPELRSS